MIDVNRSFAFKLTHRLLKPIFGFVMITDQPSDSHYAHIDLLWFSKFYF